MSVGVTVICLVIASLTACISSHRLVVVLIPVLLVNVLPVDWMVEPIELVATGEVLAPLCPLTLETLVDPV